MSNLKNMLRSIQSALSETNNFINYYDKNLYNLIFFPRIIETDIDYFSYCKLLSEIKNVANTLPMESDLNIILDPIKALPSISADEFKIYGTLPFWMMYIFLPMGIVYGIGYYSKITSLINKLRLIDSKLQSVAFSLKVNID